MRLLTSTCRHRHSVWPAVWLLLLLTTAGNIQPNPGPALTQFTQHQPSAEVCLQCAQPMSTSSDGHCLLYAVTISIHSFLNVHIPVSQLIWYTHYEFMQNYNEYLPFTGLAYNTYVRHVNNYFQYKQWQSPVVDIMPAAIANAMCI